MSQQQETQLPPSAFGAESHSIADPAAQRTYVESRAAKWVGFFLPHLRSGMSALDCGCGVGSIIAWMYCAAVGWAGEAL